MFGILWLLDRHILPTILQYTQYVNFSECKYVYEQIEYKILWANFLPPPLLDWESQFSAHIYAKTRSSLYVFVIYTNAIPMTVTCCAKISDEAIKYVCLRARVWERETEMMMMCQMKHVCWQCLACHVVRVHYYWYPHIFGQIKMLHKNLWVFCFLRLWQASKGSTKNTTTTSTNNKTTTMAEINDGFVWPNFADSAYRYSFLFWCYIVKPRNSKHKMFRVRQKNEAKIRWFMKVHSKPNHYHVNSNKILK